MLAFKGKYLDYIVSAAQHFNTDMEFLWFFVNNLFAIFVFFDVYGIPKSVLSVLSV